MYLINTIQYKILDVLKKYKTYFSTSLYYLGSSLLVAFIGIAINPLMAKNLSSSDYAVIGYFSSFNLLLVPLLHFNVMTYFMRTVYRIEESRRDIMSDTILIGLVSIGFLSVVLFCTLFYIYCQYSQVEFKFFPYAIITFLQTYLSIFFTFYLTKLRIYRKARKFATMTLVNCFLGVALSILLVVYYKFGADGKLYAALIATLILALYSFKKSLIKWQFDFSIMKDALKFGLPLTISALFWYCISGVDRAFLADLNDSYTFGIYCVAIQIASYLGIFYSSLNNAFCADIFKAMADNNKSHLLKLFSGLLFIVIIVNICFIILAPFVIGILTANRYIAATELAQIIALSNITLALYYSVVQLITGYGYVKTELIVRIVGAACSVCMFKLLINNFGFHGAAWGQVFSYLLLSIIGIGAFIYMRKSNVKQGLN